MLYELTKGDALYELTKGDVLCELTYSFDEL